MIKKTCIILGISAVYFVNAQDISTLRNTVDAYSNSSLNGSARYNAMAGSMGALGGEVSVLNSNPAGIGVNIASEMSGTLSITKSNNSSSFNGSSIDYKVNNTDLGNVGGVVAFRVAGNSPWKFVNIGVNYSNQSIEDYTETPGNANINFNAIGANNIPTTLSYAGHAYNRYGNLSKMSMAVGANYDNRIYVGGGLNFHTLVVDQYDSAAFQSSSDNNTAEYHKQYTPFSESSNGFSATVGIIGKINPQFRVGAALETPTWWTIERAFDEYENPTDGTYSENRTLSTPLKATLSAAFVPSKNLAVNIDYTIGLTKPQYKVRGDAETELNSFFNDHSRSMSEIKAGAEYRIDAFRLRAGYAYANSPFNSVDLNSFSDAGTSGNNSFDKLLVGNRTTFGAGLGYDFKSFYLDAAYQSISSDYQNPFLAGSAANNAGYFSDKYVVESNSSIVSNVKNKKDNFFLTLGWKF
ncbi:hemin receptor [Chryseobacterium sp. SNU WT5]|uniref:OmpP1/FadL family transporter n=1 Tax=Chryseobacterium sp. SNU WT5 TaxID=2594269 RepID=UPI00117D2197|nr:hemin receptor [Chryseobacterium sp. SNU WT5]QDP86469.1 hemin receptor [Chryseobacterium sp. SNU WT5]